MWKWGSLLALAGLLSACGGQDVSIANKVSLKVRFSDQTVVTKFELNPEYTIQQSASVPYEDLGSVFLVWNQDAFRNELGSIVSPPENSENLEVNPFREFPNGKDLPKMVRKQDLMEIVHQASNQAFQTSMVFSFGASLVTGGSFLSDQFHLLPKDFFATQYFSSNTGEIKASISALGPSDGDLGGLYFFVHWGINPFSEMNKMPSDRIYPLQFELYPTGPAQIESYGSWWNFYRHGNALKAIERFSNQLRPFWVEAPGSL